MTQNRPFSTLQTLKIEIFKNPKKWPWNLVQGSHIPKITKIGESYRPVGLTESIFSYKMSQNRPFSTLQVEKIEIFKNPKKWPWSIAKRSHIPKIAKIGENYQAVGLTEYSVKRKKRTNSCQPKSFSTPDLEIGWTDLDEIFRVYIGPEVLEAYTVSAKSAKRWWLHTGRVTPVMCA